MSAIEIIIFVFCMIGIIGFIGFVSVYSAKNEGVYHGEEAHYNKHKWK